MVISIKKDLLFRKCFANAEHPEVVEHFIEDVLGFEVDDIRIENPYSIAEFIDTEGNPSLRHTEVDVLVRLKDQRLATVELQRAPQEYYVPRSIFYLASRYSDDYGRIKHQRADVKDGSEKYSSLYQIYGINIVDFLLFGQDQRACRTFSFRDDLTFEPLKQGMLNLCYIELRKKAPAHLRHWIDFLNDRPAPPDAPKYIKQAYKLVDYANLNREERKMISAQERREQDHIGQMNYAKKEARAEGLAEGLAEGRTEGLAEGLAEGLTKVARNLLNAGMNLDEVARLTGLTKQEVNSLIKR